MATTPFHRLGILPQQLVGLNDDEIESLLNERYRFLAKVYHSDSGSAPNKKKFQEATEAYDELVGNRASFLEWRGRAVKEESPLKADSTEFEYLSERRALSWQTSQLAELWLERNFRTPHYRMKKFRNQTEVEFANRIDWLSSSAFHFPFGRTLMRDVFRGAVEVYRMGEDPPDLFSSDEAPWFELEELSDGGLMRHELVRQKFDSAKEQPPPDVPERWIYYSTNTYSSQYWARTGVSRRLPPLKIAGSLVDHGIRCGPNLKNEDGRRKQARNRGLDPDVSARNYKLRTGWTRDLLEHWTADKWIEKLERDEPLTVDELRPFLRQFVPRVHAWCPLVAVSTESEELRFFVLGSPGVPIFSAEIIERMVPV